MSHASLFSAASAAPTESIGNTKTILDVWAHLDVRYGGIGPAAAKLSKIAQSYGSWKTAAVAVCSGDEVRPENSLYVDTKRIDLSNIRPPADFSLAPQLAADIAKCDVCHVHGLWLPHTLAARRIATSLKKPIVSSVHGMLEKWEIRNKGLKKQIYSALFERRSLSQSACLRALSRQEAEDYRLYGLKNPIALVPTGVAPLQRSDTSDFFRRNPGLSGKKIVLFLSRVHYKKGILELVKAWPQVTSACPDAHLIVAGGDYENTTDRAKEIVTRRGQSESVTFLGRISDSDKLALLSAAKCFCLPSYSEGLSAAVLESLSIGLPVVISRACNVDGVSEANAGFVTNSPAIEEIADRIARCIGQTDQAWIQMSLAAQSLAGEKYGWEQLGKSMHSVYEWLTGGPKPPCVID